MIPTVKEPPEVVRERGCYENCVFCKRPTDKWHIGTNNPVCDACKKTHKVGELTDWRGMGKTKSRL